jgi:predicted phosphoribosyltransferase
VAREPVEAVVGRADGAGGRRRDRDRLDCTRACGVVRAHGAARVVLAAPVCSPDTARTLRAEVDELVCLETPRLFFAVGGYYIDFRPITDDEVAAVLGRTADRG